MQKGPNDVTHETSSSPAGWFPDPTGRNERRYWDGSAWSEHVFAAGSQAVDPITTNTPVSTTGTLHSTRREAREATPAPATLDAAPPAASAALIHVSAPSIEPSSVPAKIPFFGARKVAEGLQNEVAHLRGLIDQYGLLEVAELDAARNRIRQEIALAEAEIERARAAAFAAHNERTRVESEIIDLRSVTELQEYGLFDFEHPAETSVSLATNLESVRSDIKSRTRSGEATQATQNFTFNNSAAQGRKFVADMSKLLLRAYNAEAENCIKTVRAGNLDAARKRLSTVVDQVERLGKMIDLRITPAYHRLRLQELELASRHLQAVQAEKELERARRDELREQKKAEQELAREKERLQKERTHYANALAALEANGDQEGADRLRAKLADVDSAIENVDYRAANIRAGYVYVISNVGAFGPDVVKIGLTRRLDPMDRVNELGDASVPFRFDVHALFFADDAVAIEAMLHAQFAEQRINKVNLRREYFRATPQDVLEALREHQVEVLEYTLEPAAAEYRSSIAIS